MKPLSLAIALALASTAPAWASSDLVSPSSSHTLTQPATQSAFNLTDLSDRKQLAKLKSRLAKHGITAKNRPHLFELLAKQPRRAAALTLAADGKLQAAPALSGLTTNCTTSNASLCSFFKHMGIQILNKADTNEPYLVVSALNSEKSSTNYTLIDIVLVNEKDEAITLPRANEYFGDGAVDQKRKTVYSAAKLNDAIARIAKAEQIFADAWVTVVYTDANGNEVVEDRNSKVEYSRDSLLASLGINPEQPTTFAAPALAQGKTAALTAAPAPSLAGAVASRTSTLYAAVIEHPIDYRSAQGANITDNKIIICLNRNYGDCDYENIYPPTTPNDQLKLKVPFKGSLTVSGQVTRIYRPDWSVIDVADSGVGDGSTVLTPGAAVAKPELLDYGTNIFIQTKEGGGATTISGNQYQDIANFFADSLKVTYLTVSGVTKSEITWDISRNEGVFGDATLYGRYQDANWIMNLAVDNKPRSNRPARQEVYVMGSTGLDETWSKTDFPQMQIVYSCLAKGSLIRLPDGRQLPIEQLAVGDQVLGASQFSPDSALPLTITDISVGVEAIPMYRVHTASGKALLLTESHPVITQAGQPIWASELQTGDLIRTESGVERITNIATERFTDAVYNLRLARPIGSEHYQANETFSLFANGLQVGDLATQSANEFKAHAEDAEQVLQRLPSAWHADFINSQQ